MSNSSQNGTTLSKTHILKWTEPTAFYSCVKVKVYALHLIETCNVCIITIVVNCFHIFLHNFRRNMIFKTTRTRMEYSEHLLASRCLCFHFHRKLRLCMAFRMKWFWCRKSLEQAKPNYGHGLLDEQ